MIREHFEFRETITTILADGLEHIEAAKEGMVSARQDIERQILDDPFFGSTFEPYDPGSNSPVINRMVHAAERAGVGPMAAVAGTIAWSGTEAMADAGASFAVIDNGGDIAMLTDRELVMGIYAGTSAFSGKIAFRIKPQEEILGICTSSATVGHSISLGTADSVTVVSRDVSCADAYATAICNMIGYNDTETLDRIEDEMVCGILAITGDQLMKKGKLPEIVRASTDEGLITAGKYPGAQTFRI